MSLNNIAPKIGASVGSVTDGTASSLVLKDSRTNLYLIDENLVRELQRTVMFTAVDPSKTETGANGYSHARSKIVVKSPKKLSNDVTTVNLAEFKIGIDPESTPAEIQELKHLICSIILSTDADTFFTSQTTG
jgi:hypothetical protein